MNRILQDLVNLLDLETLEVNLFRGQSRDLGGKSVFGGQVIGQALVAAARTTEGVAQRPLEGLGVGTVDLGDEQGTVAVAPHRVAQADAEQLQLGVPRATIVVPRRLGAAPILSTSRTDSGIKFG